MTKLGCKMGNPAAVNEQDDRKLSQTRKRLPVPLNLKIKPITLDSGASDAMPPSLQLLSRSSIAL